MTDWNVLDFDNFIARRGYSCTLFRAHLCSCRSEVSRQPEYVCPQCLNRGDSLEKAGVFPVLVQRMGQRTGLETSGVWEFGEATVTLQRGVDIYEGDALVYEKYENRKNELIHHTKGDVDRLRFNFATRINRLSYLDAKAWERVKQLDEFIHRGEASEKEKAERDAKAREMEVVLLPERDYRLSLSDNRSFLVYTSSRRPPKDAIVSVRYFHRPELVVVGLPTDDLDADTRIARHIMAKRRDLVDKDDSGEAPYGNMEVSANA